METGSDFPMEGIDFTKGHAIMKKFYKKQQKVSAGAGAKEDDFYEKTGEKSDGGIPLEGHLFFQCAANGIQRHSDFI